MRILDVLRLRQLEADLEASKDLVTDLRSLFRVFVCCGLRSMQTKDGREPEDVDAVVEMG